MSRIRQIRRCGERVSCLLRDGDLTNNILWLGWQRACRPQMRFTHKPGRTDVGCVRANNEDNFAYNLERQIFLLCDGMGGEAAGEVASRLAVDQILAYLRSDPSTVEVQSPGQGTPESARLLYTAIRVANRSRGISASLR